VLEGVGDMPASGSARVGRRNVLTSAAPFMSLMMAVLFLGACVGPSMLERRASLEEREAYASALERLQVDRAAAETALQQFIQTYPESPLADDAAEQLARLAFAEGRSEDASRWLRLIVTQYPSGDRSDAARVRLARWEYDAGAMDEAQQMIQRVRTSRLTLAERQSLYRLEAELAVDSIERIGHLAQLRRSLVKEAREADSDPESVTARNARNQIFEVDEQIGGLLGAMTDARLERAASALRARPPAARIRLLLAQRALDAGRHERAEGMLLSAKRHELTETDEERLAALQHALGLGLGALFLPTFAEAAAIPPPSTEGARGAIGVVLPLSGRYASFGQESLRGVLLAAGIFDRAQALPPRGEAATGGERPSVPGPGAIDERMERPPLRIVVRDSAGKAERAAEAVRELAEDAEVLAIVGPIFSDESEAAAKEAERHRIPLLTLSNREEVPADRDYVFRLRTTAKDEVGFLVDHAVDVLEAKKFAVLYPRSRYGRGMRKRYWEAVLERGGSIVAAASYDASATDFNDPIRSMIGYDLLSSDERLAIEERRKVMRRARRLEPEEAAQVRDVIYPMVGPDLEMLPPIVDFDALFIPDSHDKIALIAPQLAYHEIKGVQLLGTSEWNDPQLVRIARRHVRGAVMATPFYKESPYPFVTSFLAAYRESFGHEPDSFSSHGFDAANLVLVQLAAGRDSRPRVREGVLRTAGYPGVSGIMSIFPDGNARKRPFLLSVKRGRISGLD